MTQREKDRESEKKHTHIQSCKLNFIQMHLHSFANVYMARDTRYNQR